MSKLVIIATIELLPGTTDRAVKILLDHRERCLRDEPGTLQFEVLVPSDTPLGPGAPIPETKRNTVMLYEVYKDSAAFDDHWNGSSVAQARKEAGAIFVGGGLIRLEAQQAGNEESRVYAV